MDTNKLIHAFQTELVNLELKAHFSDVELFEQNCRNQCRRNVIQGMLFMILQHKDMIDNWVFKEEDDSCYGKKERDLKNPSPTPVHFSKQIFEEFIEKYVEKTIKDFEQYLIDKPVKPIETLKDVVDKFEIETYEGILRTLKQHLNGN